jgi:hypothetical protein
MKLSSSFALILLLSTARAAAQEAAPSDEELAQDAALAKLGKDSESLDGPASSTKKSPFVYDLRLNLMLTATGNDPETRLLYDVMQRPLLGPVVVFRRDELLRPRAARVYPSLSAAAGAEWELSDLVLLRALVDSGELRDGSTVEPEVDGVALNGQPVGDELRSLSIVRELSITLGKQAFEVELGRLRATVAEGLVYDDFGTGARARLDLAEAGSIPLHAELVATTVGQRTSRLQENPMLALEIAYDASLLESIGVFAALASDKSGALSDVLRSSVAERHLAMPVALNALFSDDKGHGQIGYLGAHAQLLVASKLLLRATAVLSTGAFSLTIPQASGQSAQQKIEVRSGAADVELHYTLSSKLDLATYAFALSGDDSPTGAKSTYHAFIGLAPYWVWTGLFFSGGLNQSLLANRAAAAGVNGHGVIGAGPAIEWSDAHGSAELRVIWLEAIAPPPAAPYGGSGRAYGLEADLHGQWKATRWLSAGAELDVLIPGNYFPENTIAYRMLGLVSVAYGN